MREREERELECDWRVGSLSSLCVDLGSVSLELNQQNSFYFNILNYLSKIKKSIISFFFKY